MARPTKYKPEYADLVYKFALLGATNERLAELFDVAVSTIDKWIVDQPAFSGALKAGRDIADAEVSKSLYHRAMGYSHPAVKIVADAKTGQDVQVPYIEHYPPDTTACIFWLKNRQRGNWRDRHEVTGKDGDPLFKVYLGVDVDKV